MPMNKLLRKNPGNWNLAGWSFIYLLCLVPVSVDGYSVNYLYAIIPVLFAILLGRIQKPSILVMSMVFLCAAVFSLSSLYQFEFVEYYERRWASFLLFVSMFFLAFTHLEKEHIKAFKYSVILISVFLCVGSAWKFYVEGGQALHFEAKDAVGTQRIGFLYILALWIVWLGDGIVVRMLSRIILTVLLVLGIALTFSRAAFVATVLSGAFYLVYLLAKGSASVLAVIKTTVSISGIILLSVLMIYWTVPIMFDFIGERLFDYILSGDASTALGDSDSSDGTRIFIWTKILEFVAYNPFTGSGFLGPWILNLYGDKSGSSHSQYFDVLFRLGLPGFLLFYIITYKVLKYFGRAHLDLFVGLFGILVYGLFHETFKDSQGGFIFAFMLAMYSSSKNNLGLRFASGHA